MPPEENAPLETEEPETQEEETSEEEQKPQEEIPAWQEPMNDLRAQISNMPAQTAAIVKSVLEAQKSPEPEPEQPENMAEVWKMAGQSPELFQALVDKQIEDARQRERTSLKAEMADMLTRRDADYDVATSLGKHSEDLQDRESEIMRGVPQAERTLAAYLKSDVAGSDVHKKLAYLLAAAANPEAVSKRHVSRAKAERESRDAMINRASMGGAGGSGVRPRTAKVNEDIMAGLGMDLGDKAIRARIEKYLKTGDTMYEIGDSEGK